MTTQSAESATLPARLLRLTTHEKLDAAVFELGPDAVRPILDAGDGLCDAAADRCNDGPWWKLLSDVLEELCGRDVRTGWESLFHSIKQAEAVAPPQLDHLVCTVESLLHTDPSSDEATKA